MGNGSPVTSNSNNSLTRQVVLSLHLGDNVGARVLPPTTVSGYELFRGRKLKVFRGSDFFLAGEKVLLSGDVVASVLRRFWFVHALGVRLVHRNTASTGVGNVCVKGGASVPLSPRNLGRLHTLGSGLSCPRVSHLCTDPVLHTERSTTILCPGVPVCPISGLGRCSFNSFRNGATRRLSLGPSFTG